MPEQQIQQSFTPPAQEPATPTQGGATDFGDNSAMQGRMAAASTPKAAFAAAAASPTSPLPYQGELQARFGASMTDLRAHLGQQGILQSLGAEAATDGRDLVFASNNPDKETVTEEVAHAMQARVGSSGGSGVSNPNDPAEREAKAVASGQGDSVGLGMSAGVMRKEATSSAIGEDFVITQALDPSCATLSPKQEAKIDAFVLAANALVVPWSAARASGEYYLETAGLVSLLSNIRAEFAADSGKAGLVDSRNIQTAELARRLRVGTFASSIQEIHSFNPLSGLNGYLEMLAMPAVDVEHNYNLTTVAALSAGVDIVADAGARTSLYHIKYSNSLGMSWECDVGTVTSIIGAGPSIPPFFGDFETSGKHQDVSAGTATPDRYFAPSFFTGAEVQGQSASIGLALVTDTSSLLFSSNGRSLMFDTSGVNGGIGTSQLPNATIQTQGGRAKQVGETENAFAGPLAEFSLGAPIDWQTIAEAGIHFGTGSVRLSESGQRTISMLSEIGSSAAIQAPNGQLRITIVGRASTLWQRETPSKDATQHNQQLAGQRALLVDHQLRAAFLSKADIQSTQTLLSESEFAAFASAASRENPNDNRQEDRAVYVRIEFSACEGTNE